ncbi:histidine kinase, partial [Ensifer sp. IC4062]|nr:histidine kinase [Ensifer sp. IC4062]
MSENKPVDTNEAPISAEQLRMQMLEREMAEMEKERKLRSAQEQKLADFAADFLEKHVTE